MARILLMSSYVARGTVGLQGAAPLLTSAGHDVIALPTVVLSNHPGHGHHAGVAMPERACADMIEALDRNGWLAGVAAVITGYFPNAGLVTTAHHAIGVVRRRNPGALIICDPVVGDDPGGLYVDQDVAVAIRNSLMPLATLATPNRFELEWLTGGPIRTIDDAADAAHMLGPALIAATSIPDDDGQLATLLSDRDGEYKRGVVWVSSTKRLPSVPHGTGDLFTALLAHALLTGDGYAQALGYACGGVAAAIAKARHGFELDVSFDTGTILSASFASVRPFLRRKPSQAG